MKEMLQSGDKVFILNGYTRDRFICSDGVTKTFAFFLKDYLKEELGYERLIFLDHEGAYFLDKNSLILTIGEEEEKNNNSTDSGRTLNIIKVPGSDGPGGACTHTPPKEGENLIESDKWRYRDFKDLAELRTWLKNWMLNDEIKTGIIFYDDKFIQRYNLRNEEFIQFSGDLETKFQNLDPDRNQNIILFIYSNLGIKSLELKFNNREWNGLLNIGCEDGQQKNYYYVGCPAKDEIENIIKRYHITEQKEISLENWDKIINELAALAKKKGYSLKKFLNDINNTKRIDLDWLEECFDLVIRGQDSAREKFDSLIGMQELKDIFYEFLDGADRPKINRKAGQYSTNRIDTPEIKLDKEVNRFHLALLGNPGTGKTTVAQCIGRILHEEGLLEIGHTVQVSGGDLISDHVGGTAIKTQEKIEEAMGGVLFIDEAYALNNNQFGPDAIDTLVNAMTERAGEFVVIFAGYKAETEEMISQNTGLPSRVKKIHLKDYNEEELAQIFELKASEDKLSSEISNRIYDFAVNLLENRAEHGGENFANARVIENILNETRRRARSRAKQEGLEEVILKLADFPDKVQSYFQKTSKDDNYSTKLDQLIGLDNVKRMLRNKKYELKQKKRMQKQGINIELAPGHYIFKGNPGTGKTTVAEIMGQMFYDLGLIETNKIISRSASELVGQHVGETEKKVNQLLKKSLGGVLFIDEAHQLYSEEDSSSFGKKALQTIVSFMEANRKEFSLIIAGYPVELDEMMEVDPSLEDKFTAEIEFSDYNNSELTEIFKLFIKENGLRLGDGAEDIFKEKIAELKNNKEERFANARSVRKLYNKIFTNLARRLDVDNEAEMDLITSLDVARIGVDYNSQADIYDLLKELTNEVKLSSQFEALLPDFAANLAEAEQTELLLEREFLVAIKKARQENIIFDIDHLATEIRDYCNKENSKKEILDELDSLIGLANVKDLISKIKNKLILAKKQGREIEAGHYIFKGNPGTGKTTVAKYMAQQLAELGAIRNNKLNSYTASDLMGQYVGQTENKTKKILKRSLGGVLFIDEAHQLYEGNNQSGRSYGNEVIKTLVPFMEDNKDKFSLILAGYPVEMEVMLKESDPGFKGRFDKEIYFKDYEGAELLDIFYHFAKEKEYSLEEGIEEPLLQKLEELKEKEGSTFANARSVRNFFGQVEDRLAQRVAEEGESEIFKIKKIDI